MAGTRKSPRKNATKRKIQEEEEPGRGKESKKKAEEQAVAAIDSEEWEEAEAEAEAEEDNDSGDDDGGGSGCDDGGPPCMLWLTGSVGCKLVSAQRTTVLRRTFEAPAQDVRGSCAGRSRRLRRTFEAPVQDAGHSCAGFQCFLSRIFEHPVQDDEHCCASGITNMHLLTQSTFVFATSFSLQTEKSSAASVWKSLFNTKTISMHPDSADLDAEFAFASAVCKIMTLNGVEFKLSVPPSTDQYNDNYERAYAHLKKKGAALLLPKDMLAQHEWDSSRLDPMLTVKIRGKSSAPAVKTVKWVTKEVFINSDAPLAWGKARAELLRHYRVKIVDGLVVEDTERASSPSGPAPAPPPAPADSGAAAAAPGPAPAPEASLPDPPPAPAASSAAAAAPAPAPDASAAAVAAAPAVSSLLLWPFSSLNST